MAQQETQSLWYGKIAFEVEHQKEAISQKDYRFFNIDRFLRVAQWVGRFSAECEYCRNSRSEVEALSENLTTMLNGSREQRADFERRSERLAKHLVKSHDLSLIQYYTSTYSLAGMAIGLVAGALFSLPFGLESLKYGLLIGWGVGLIAGRIAGGEKDFRYRKRKRLL